MGNRKGMVRALVLVMVLFFAVMVGAQPGPPGGVGNDTNAATECGTGELLDGDGNCIATPVDTDTNAATECPIYHALLGGGMCLDMTTQFVGQKCSTGIRFVDLVLTVFDCDTNLYWEKKVAADSVEGNCADIQANRDVRCVNNRYEWTGTPWHPDGPAFTVFLDTLNTPPCFAGHCDWRLPEMGPPFPFSNGIKLNGDPADTQELETIVDCGFGSPCIDPIFGPTAADVYWSSVTGVASPPFFAWVVDFSNGNVVGSNKDVDRHIRAARPGP